MIQIEVSRKKELEGTKKKERLKMKLIGLQPFFAPKDKLRLLLKVRTQCEPDTNC
jgi:hypothetical protein